MDHFIGSLAIFSFSLVPDGWAQCNGQLLAIQTNQALFAVLGTKFGGDGQTTFALPDLRGRTPIHFGGNHTLGSQGGKETYSLSINEIPKHSHKVSILPPCNTGPGTSNSPLLNYPAAVSTGSYGTRADAVMGMDTQANAAQTESNGGGQPFSIMQPYLTLNICIALDGPFPERP